MCNTDLFNTDPFSDSFKLSNSLIAIRVFDAYTIDGEPTWLDHI